VKLPASNLLEDAITQRCRMGGLTNGDSTVTISVDFDPDGVGRRAEIGVMAAMRPRLSYRTEIEKGVDGIQASDTIRYRLSATASGNSEKYDSGSLTAGMAPGSGYHVHMPAAVVTGVRYATIEIASPTRITTPNDFIDLGGLWFGPRFDFSIGYAAPFRWSVTGSIAPQRAARSSAAYPARNESRVRVWGCDFRTVPEPDASAIEGLLYDVADQDFVLICRDRTDPTNNTLRAMIEDAAYEQTALNLRRMPITFNEAF
jgi:hypothetical protein